MISFIDKQLDKNNFKVWLYSPGGSFLGELIVDNPILTLQLEGLISTFDFTIPESIDIVEQYGLTSVVNPRLNEALNQFQVEVWYGDLNTNNYQKQRFIIIDTPNAFSNDITRFSYRSYSKEYENKFVRVLDWPGVFVQEYVQRVTYNINSTIDTQVVTNLTRTPKDTRLIRVELVKDFVYRLVNQTVGEAPYQFAIPPKLNTIEIYKKVNSSWSLLVQGTDYEILSDAYTGVKSIRYIVDNNSNLSLGDITYVEYKLKDPLTFSLIRVDSPTLRSEYDFYFDENTKTIRYFIPNIPKLFSKDSVLSYDNDIPVASQIKVNIYYEATDVQQNDEVFNNVTKEALTIKQVINSLLQYGDEDNSSAKWTAFYSEELGNELRSGFAFNNATLLSAFNETLKSFDAIALPDTINKRFYIYAKEKADVFIENDIVVSSYKQPTQFSIEYGKYLKDVQQSITTENIVTIIRGVGRDNLTASSATPTGYNEWEDYTYYLDGAIITNLEDILANPNTNKVPIVSRPSRWMSNELVLKLLLWQFARSSIEEILYETMPANLVSRLGTYTSKGLVIAQDTITELIVDNETKRTPLRIEKAKNETLLTTLEISQSVEHLIAWSGSFEGVSYSGIEGYRNYINAKNTKVNNDITTIENQLTTLNEDFNFINDLLQQIYTSIEKDKFVAIFNNNDLSSYNFNENNFVELNGFRREGLYDNKFITKSSALFLAMKEEINSLKQPRVEVSANIIGLLQTTEARSEWNKLVLGGVANLIVDRLNIDLQIQIKTLTIAPDANNTTINFSTEKNYIGIGQKYLGRFFSNAAYNLKNNLGYNEGFWNRGSADGEEAANKLAQGFLISGENPLLTSTIIVDDSGITTDGHTVNPLDDTVASASSDVGRMLLFGFVKINAGRIDVFNRNQLGQLVNKVVIAPSGFTQENNLNIVSMDVDGFKIAKKTINGLEPQFFVDTNGNIVFAGTISQTVYDELNIKAIIIDAPGFFIRINADGSNPTPSSITLTATLANGFTTFNWQYFNGTNWINFNNTTNTITIAHNNPVWISTVLQVRCVTNNDQLDEVSLYKVLNGVDGNPGPPGPPGATGSAGPGVVFRGRYKADEFYFHTSTRRDIVTPFDADSPAFLANNTSKSGTNTWGTPGGADWLQFGAQFSSVATDILLTTDANIRRALVMGDTAGNVGVIRSASVESKNDIISASPPQTGFFIDGLDGSINANIGRIGGWNMTANGLSRSATTTFTNPLPPFGTFNLSYSCSLNPEEIRLDYENTSTSDATLIRLNPQGVLITGTGGSIRLNKTGIDEPFENSSDSSRIRLFGGDVILEARRDFVLSSGRGDTNRLNNQFVRKTDPNNVIGANREIPGAVVNAAGTTITFYIDGRALVVNTASASAPTPPTPPPPPPPPPQPNFIPNFIPNFVPNFTPPTPTPPPTFSPLG